ncbi:hypothetical protein PENTCL1PPCAC_3189, partial [Pristionchus entomophagus]
NDATALVERGWYPQHVAIALDDDVAHEGHLEVAVRIIEQHDVGQPHFIRRHSNLADSSVVRWVPAHLEILPHECQPDVSVHHLIFL